MSNAYSEMVRLELEEIEAGQLAFSDWVDELQQLFPEEEFWIAVDTFSFTSCYKRGETPQQAYDAFDAWAGGRDLS